MKYYPLEVYKETLPQCSIYDYMYALNKDDEENIAINYFGKRYSYKWLFSEIEKVAEALTSIGVKQGEVVSVVSVSTVVSVLVFYALNKIGAVSNYINVLLNEEKLANNFKDGNSKVVIVLDLFGNKVLKASKEANVNTIISYSISEYMPAITKLGYKTKAKIDLDFQKDEMVVEWKDFILNRSHTEILKKNPETVCFYGHTGGTTGVPKTVLLSDNCFNSVAWNYTKMFPHDRDDTFLSVMVPFVTYGSIINIHMPLCLGLEVVLIPKFDAEDWSTYMKKYRPNHICAIPAYISAILDDKKIVNMDLSFVKTIAMGGEGMNVPLEQKLNEFMQKHNSRAKVMKGYGMTEVCATSATCYHEINKLGSVGIPLVKNNFAVFGEDNDELKYGEVGEICMQCVSTMLGYKNLDSNELIKTHPDGSKWIHTGDIGYIDEDGFIFVEGRMKRMIMTIHDGVVYKISPANTEKVIDECDGVEEACVVSKKIGANIGLKAYVVCEKDCNQASYDIEKCIMEKCKNELSEHQLPDLIEFIETMPRTAAGKVDYRKLEEKS